MNVLHAVNDYPADLLQASVWTHGRYSVALNEDVALSEQFNGFQGRSARSEYALTAFDKAVLVPYDVAYLDDVACYSIFQYSYSLL